MLGTLINVATAAYAGAGAWQGRKRKLSGELSRLVGVSMVYLIPLKGVHDELFAHSFIGKAVDSFVLNAEEESP